MRIFINTRQQKEKPFQQKEDTQTGSNVSSNNEVISLESLKDNDYELIKTNNKYFIYHFDNISFYEIEAESFKKIFHKLTKKIKADEIGKTSKILINYANENLI